MRKVFIIVGLAVCAGVVGCGSEHPEITTDLNVFVMWGGNALISGEQDQEINCPTPTTCPGTAPVCWNNGNLIYGYCRECDPDNSSCGSLACDYGWCHQECSSSTECDTGEFCTDSRCRKSHIIDVSVCNRGGGNLEVYTDRTKVYGNSDACAFAQPLDWEKTGTVVLSKGKCIYLRINFTPTVDGALYRAYVPIYSNDTTLNPLPLLLCGRGAEASCSEENKINGSCLDESPASACGDITELKNTEAVCPDLK